MLPCREIFRAYDIRGITDTVLNADSVRQIGQAFGSECQARGQRQVIVARDGRLSGPELLAALSEGLRASGCDVIDIGMVPTPLLYFATYHLQTGTGVMLTGSHNPPNYNGLKMMIGGETLYGDAILALYERLQRHRLHSGTGALRRAEVVADYLARVCGDIRLDRPLRIGIDCGNGVAAVLAKTLFSQLGCEVHELYGEVDGHFPNHHPDPSKPENLRDLSALVRRQKLDLGLAFDGDGDRVGVIDDQGELIWPDRQMILFSQDLLERKPGAHILYDVKCTRLLPQAITTAGGRAEMYKTGHSLIKARMKETGALLGGEMSGHIFFKERWYGFDDGLYSGARLLEILSRQTCSASHRFGQIPDSYNTPELNISFAEGEHYAFMQQLTAQGFAQAHFPEAELSMIDGLRADFDDGWGLVRASNTTSMLVIRFEADSRAALARIQALFRAALYDLQADIALPF